MTTPPIPNLTPEQIAALQAQQGPPQPPPPTPASAGYAAWAADPVHSQKIANSLVKPGQSILPPNAANAAQEAAPVATHSPADPNAPPAPSLNMSPYTAASTLAQPTPSQPSSALIAPQGLQQAPPAASSALMPPGQPEMPTQPSAPQSAMIPPAPMESTAPAASAAWMPPGTTPASPFPSKDEYFAAHPDQMAKPVLGGSLLHRLALGLVAGGENASGYLAKQDSNRGSEWIESLAQRDRSIPDINQARYKAAVIEPAQAGVALQNTVAQTDLRGAQRDKADAQTVAIPQKQAESEVKLGLVRDNGGNLAFDPSSPFAKNMEAKTALDQYGAEVHRINALGGTPGTEEFHYKVEVPQQLAAERLKAQLAGLGIKAKQLGLAQAREGAMDTGIDPRTGKPFPGAQQIADKDGNLTTLGSRFAPGATEAQGKAAQFAEVHGGLDQLDTAAQQLAAKTGGSLNTPGVIAALSHARNADGGWIPGAVTNYLKGENASALSPEERNYVQTVGAAHERVQGMRKSAGGGATDSQVDRLDAIIPDATTPDINYLTGQTGQIRSILQSIGPGVPTVAGGLTVKGKGDNAQAAATPPKGGQVSVTAPDGSVHSFPDSAAAAKFKRLAGIK